MRGGYLFNAFRPDRERARLTREGIEIDRRIHDALTALAAGARAPRRSGEPRPTPGGV